MGVQGAEPRRNGVYCLYVCLSVITKWQFFQFCPKLRRQKTLISVKQSATLSFRALCFWNVFVVGLYFGYIFKRQHALSISRSLQKLLLTAITFSCSF